MGQPCGPAHALVRIAATTAALLLPGAAHAQLLSPGELARAHADLGSDADCTKCHASGRRVAENLCNDCHDDIGQQRRTGAGLHGTRFKQDGCGHCHVEHRGRSHELIRWPGGSRDGFTHEMTGFELHGGHAGVACGECHTRKNRRGVASFLEPPATCQGCHKDEDVHEGRFGRDCAKCHNDERWKGIDPEHVDHDLTRFALKGEHKKVECDGCHGDPPRYRDLEFSTCESCHEDPHKGRLGEQCASCHAESAWDDLHMARTLHPGLRITGGHTRVACNACHDQGLLRPPTEGNACVDCHQPVHEARFGNRCERCHKRVRWLGLPVALGRKVHHLTAFGLSGQHEQVACEACHKPDMPRAERYRGLAFEQCRDCHADAHGGKLSRFVDGDCGSCHDTFGFRPTLFSVEQHQVARFALIGRHVAVPCAGCHTSEPPRLDWTVANHACADCHENPHGDQFAREMAAGGCASCHSPVAWNAPKIDHSIWPLTGAHELAPCAACHDATAEDRKAGRGPSYRGAPRQCHQCHEDSHLGQFRLSDPVRACDHCHTPTQFAIEHFDHEDKAGYALEGKHADLPCADCHPPATLDSGLETARYRLGYRACVDCHADPHAGAQP